LYLAWIYIHFPLLIGVTGFGISIEHLVLGHQSLPLPLLLIFVIAITLVGQVILDIRHHPYHRVFKF